MSAADQTKPPLSPPTGGEDDIIELTEVVAETPDEVVLEFNPVSDDLDSLKPPAPPPAEPEEAPTPPAQESLDDFLASLPELPEDLDIPTEAPPLEIQPSQDLRQELAQRLDDTELKELVREVVQETVARLVRELLPKMAAAALDKEIQLLKKRLTEPE